MARFQTAGCVNCHSGPMFSDYAPHVLAVPDNNKRTMSDSGVNGTYAFRTASLRDLAYTAPYMHSGAFATLRDVINFYDRARGGGRGGGGRGGDGRGGDGRNTADEARAAVSGAARRIRTSRGINWIRSSVNSICVADDRTI